MDRRLREEQVAFLQKIKPFLLRNHHVPDLEKLSEDKEPAQPSKDDVITELMKRLERLERSVGTNDQDAGFRKARIKDRIISILQEKKRLTASEMSEMVGLSRTRCSEYFRELMLEGRVEGVLINRQKYYKVLRA